MRYVAGRPRRSSSVRCFSMVRHASLRGDTPYWLAMARYDIPGVRRYASVCVGSGSPVWLVMVRFAGGRGVRRFASPSPMARPGRVARYGAPVAQCRAMARPGGSLGCSAMFRLTGSRGPGRLSSGTAAGSATLASHCFPLGGIFFREPGSSPGAGARIRAGKGSVTAPDVPVPVTVCVLVQVAHYGAVAVPRVLSHCPAVKYGIAGFGEFSKGRHALSHCPTVKYGVFL